MLPFNLKKPFTALTTPGSLRLQASGGKLCAKAAEACQNTAQGFHFLSLILTVAEAEDCMCFFYLPN